VYDYQACSLLCACITTLATLRPATPAHDVEVRFNTSLSVTRPDLDRLFDGLERGSFGFAIARAICTSMNLPIASHLHSLVQTPHPPFHALPILLHGEHALRQSRLNVPDHFFHLLDLFSRPLILALEGS
jgi:hypothetical protein